MYEFWREFRRYDFDYPGIPRPKLMLKADVLMRFLRPVVTLCSLRHKGHCQ